MSYLNARYVALLIWAAVVACAALMSCQRPEMAPTPNGHSNVGAGATPETIHVAVVTGKEEDAKDNYDMCVAKSLDYGFTTETLLNPKRVWEWQSCKRALPRLGG